VTAAVLKIPGAKAALMPWIAPHIPGGCRRVVDLFTGTAAFALGLPYRPEHLVINDLHEDVVGFYQVLREQPEALARLVSLTPWARVEYLRVVGPRGVLVRTGRPVEDARRFLVATWQAQGALQGQRSGWRHKGRTVYGAADTVETWLQLPARLLAVAEALRGAEIECRPALDLIRRYTTPETLLYADPPYVRQRTVNGRRRSLYRHEMTDDDHAALLEALKAHPGPVLLSGYRSELYDAALPHWRRVDRETKAQGGRARVESLWLNPICEGRLGYGPLFDQLAQGVDRG
jgi:DNA adenine methylase